MLLIRGGDSPHFPDSDLEDFLVLFPGTEEKTIPGAGHWLHISAAGEFAGIVSAFLDRIDSR